ncbi:hypothetical protein [Desulfocastanea catecholica]
MLPGLGNKQLKAIVKMDQDIIDNLADDTLFWIVRPQLSARSVEGLDTTLSGSFKGLQIGTGVCYRKIEIGKAKRLLPTGRKLW